MPRVSRGFVGRRQPVADASRVPPGQYVTGDFPVLSAGPTPYTPLEEWSFAIDGAIDEPVSWQWQEFVALPSETITVDIHCVTKWSKLDTSWKGVSVDTLLEGAGGQPRYVTNAFVEAIAGQLAGAGNDPGRIRTERFGPSGA